MEAQKAAVAGYTCEFVDEIPKELQTECSICLHVLRDPHMVECCGCHFCGGCIQSLLREFNACPLCNSKQPRTVADKQLSRSLKEKKDEISKELQTECSICLHVLRDPHMVVCCGYRFCGGCIQSVLRKFNTCPLCNSKQPRTVADKQLSRSLKEKKVKCTHREDGCEWVGELAALDEHLEVTRRIGACRLRSIRCQYCQFSCAKSKLEAHETICLKRTTVCKYCNTFQCLQCDLPSHLEVCGQYPVTCPKGCGATITRTSLDHHVTNWCPLAIVECEYAYAGCKAKVSRKDVKEHAKQSMENHLTLLTQRFSALKQETDKGAELERKIAKKTCEASRAHQAADRREIHELKTELERLKLEKSKQDVAKDEEIDLLKRLCDIRGGNDYSLYAYNQAIVINLPARADEDMLSGLFGQYGPVNEVEMYDDHRYGCIAVVSYESNDAMYAMLKKYSSSGIRLLGYQLKCIHLGYYNE